MIRGSCNCDQIAFEVFCEPEGIYLCHCSICRRHTGTHGNAVIVVPRSDFCWQRGAEKVSTWRKPGHDWQIWFCSECGAQVPGKNDGDSMFVPVGSITEGGDGLRVIHHIWVGSKAPWHVIGDDGEQHPAALDRGSIE